ncbi:Single-stranded DNA binding protein Ssb [Candidatus Tiddalikarchaeum anstoanum]|nr:Single-stranded DNA binding protein Ssb [Candidatus Tiddalikarchaeum anstoanum]
MNVSRLGNLNPRVWGITVHFKVLSKIGDIREVKYQDEVHKVGDYKIGDESGVIILSLWDDYNKKIKVGKVYEVTEARLLVFNNNMKLSLSKKSEMKEIKEEIKVDESNDMSEKFVEAPKKFGYKRNNSFYDKIR